MSIEKKKQVFVSRRELTEQFEYAQKVSEQLSELYPNGYIPLAHVHSYGCQQNVSDGEKIKGMLAQMGFGFSDSPDNADFVLYNTCAVREHAEDRVFGNVGALKHYKRRRPNMLIALCGCMIQQEHIADRVMKSYPYVDLVFGTHVTHKLPQMIYEKLKSGKRVLDITDSDGVIAEGIPIQRDGDFKAWLPVMYGCNNFCSYCIVPYVRGRERSRKSDDILAEAASLAAQGYKEIMLLGQNVNSYGSGSKEDEISFSQLLRQMNEIEGDFRIRFMTSHPKDATFELIDTIAECDKVCNHLHLPVQSGSNSVLKAMNRKYTVEDYLKLIDYAKEKIPDISFTSDIIIGFPGETYSDFCQTLSLVKQVEYDQLYTFLFSKRKGTPAASLDDPVPAEEKSKWFQELLRVQDQISDKRIKTMVGATFRVLPEAEGKTGTQYLSGRADNNVIVEFKGDSSLIGKFVNVRITTPLHFSCLGEIVD